MNLSREKQLDFLYYLNRMILPPLERHFNLMGADIRGWFEEMPKPQKVENGEKQPDRAEAASPLTVRRRSNKKSSGLKIDQHFASNVCLVCEAITPEGESRVFPIDGFADSIVFCLVICTDCQDDPASTTADLLAQLRLAEKRSHDCQIVCASCSGSAPVEDIKCESLDCSWLYERLKAQKEVKFWKRVPEMIIDLEY